MGKLNEIQEQMTQSYGSNSFTTTIKENTVEFDSLKDKFTFKDPVEAPSIIVNGQESVAFTSEDRTKLDNLQTPMQIQGRVDSVEDLADLTDVNIGDVYLVGESGQETFEEYVCTGFDGSDESAIWESVGTTQAQADWNQNDSTAVDYVKNRTHYTEVTSQTTEIFSQALTLEYDEEQGAYGTYIESQETFLSQDGDSSFTIDINGYEFTGTLHREMLGAYIANEDNTITIGLYEERAPEPPYEYTLVGIGVSDLSVIGGNTEITLTLSKTGAVETVHQLDDKYISSNIARTSDIPEQAFNIDDEDFIIYPTFTNDTNTVNTSSSLILAAPSTANNSFGGSNNVSIAGANGFNTISGRENIAILSSSSTTVGGSFNTVISSYGSSQSMGDSENGSIMIGGVGGISMSGGGYQKVAINAGYGTSITGSHSTVISSAAVIGASNSTVLGVASGSARTITDGNSHMILGGDTAPKTISNGSNNSIIGSGYSSIENGSTNLILGCNSASITGSSTYTCAMISAPSNSVIQGGAGNMIIGGATWAPITIPSSVSNCIVIGGGVTNPAESNTVYLNTLNATVGVKTKKLTIAGIDPTDVFMHSEIIDASSDVAFSRTIANTNSDKTDGYVEILYKASSGVTCSAYIDSADVALTADGAWHKLEQGCDPADGVEIHINNSAPVTDATLEVISKVYYI